MFSASKMNNLIVYPSRDFNSSSNSVLDKEENTVSKYRNIPVLKIFDNIQSPVRYYENVSCVREVNSSKDEKSCIFGDVKSSKDEKSFIFGDVKSSKEEKSFIFGDVKSSKDEKSCIFGDVKSSKNEKSCIFGDGLESKFGGTSNKKRTKPDSVVQVNPQQFKHRSSLSFFERMGQGSVSEPTLCNAKDRGDSITLQDICTENEFHCNKYNNAAKYGSTKDREIKGCIYVKNGGKLFKSIIETKTIQFEDGGSCGLPGRKSENDNPLHLGESPAKSSLLRFTSKGRQRLKDEPNDFEVAIFLSGIGNISEKSLRRQKVFVNRKKKSESRFKQDKKGKKKRKKNDAASFFGKEFTTLQESYQDASNLVTVSHYDSGKNFCNMKKQPSRWLPDFSSESGSEGACDVKNKMRKARRPKKVFRNTSALRLSTSIDNRNQKTRESHAPGNKSALINRSEVMSEPSLFQFIDEFKVPKSKIRDHILWEKFESIFRKYASTSRHSGEVIPRKISTEWMTRAGVVNVILTENEADEAFRQAAGVKITMNAQEYKEFLIMLTLRMKLPYYEIYRRMCGI